MNRLGKLSVTALLCVGLIVSGTAAGASAATGSSTAEQAADSNFQVLPSADPNSFSVVLKAGSARPVEGGIEVLDGQGAPIDTLPTRMTAPSGEVITMDYQLPSPTEITATRVSPAPASAPPAPATTATWDESWDKCVFDAGVAGAVAGGMLSAGALAAVTTCSGKPYMS